MAVLLAAAESGRFADFISGLLLGGGIGFLAGPAVRSWLAYREWAEASRQARLTDEILARMEDVEPGQEAGRGTFHSFAPLPRRISGGIFDPDEEPDPGRPWQALS